MEETVSINEILSHPNFLLLKTFRHHNKTTTYTHVTHVALVALSLGRVLHLTHEEMHNLCVGALLHDYFLYDFHETGRVVADGIHAWSHPRTALRNAVRDFELNARQMNIIRSHMFPTSLLHPPKCVEAWVVCLADKYCAVSELIFQRKFGVSYSVNLGGFVSGEQH